MRKRAADLLTASLAKQNRSKTLTFAMLGLLISLGVGTTNALFTDPSNNGNNKFDTAAAQESEITAGAYVADLYRGAVKSVTIHISNPNNYAVRVVEIDAGSSKAVGSPECPPDTVTTDARSNPLSGIPQQNGAVNISAGGSGTYVITTRMSPSMDEACKGQIFAIPLTADIESVTS